jgi:predicted ATPase
MDTSTAVSQGHATSCCACAEAHETRRVVLTGGPGAGKTAVLEMVRSSLCQHVRVLPEAASIVFGGGFPREDDLTCRRAEQRAIYFVQRELEVIGAAHAPAVLLCDRGTLDGLAYWPGPVEDFWESTHTTLEHELARYDLVVHLRTPRANQGYNHQNPLRTESASVAARIDERIATVWEQHPRRVVVEASGDFLDKAVTALAIVRAELPVCCVSHLDTAAMRSLPAG